MDLIFHITIQYNSEQVPVKKKGSVILGELSAVVLASNLWLVKAAIMYKASHKQSHLICGPGT